MVTDTFTKQLENVKEARGDFFGNKAHHVWAASCTKVAIKGKMKS
jgi:hypothetical protein